MPTPVSLDHVFVSSRRCTCLLLDENLFNANTGDDQVAIRLCDMVDHLDGRFFDEC
jgi:hypothetical protein